MKWYEIGLVKTGTTMKHSDSFPGEIVCETRRNLLFRPKHRVIFMFRAPLQNNGRTLNFWTHYYRLFNKL